MGTETLYPHFLSFHARCGLIMYMQTIWQRACQMTWLHHIRKSDVIKQDQHLHFEIYLHTCAWTRASHLSDMKWSSTGGGLFDYTYVVSRNNFLYPPPHATSHQNRRHHCPRQTILRDELSTSSRWFASQLAFLLSNIAEQKSRPSPSKSGMGGRYFIDYQLYYIMRCFGVGEQQTFQNFPPTKLNAPIASCHCLLRVVREAFWWVSTAIIPNCHYITSDVISQRFVVISQRWMWYHNALWYHNVDVRYPIWVSTFKKGGKQNMPPKYAPHP